QASSGCEAMLSRAALLLRVASGSTAALLKDAGLTSATIAFWWKSLGQNRGIWEGEKEESELIDLWADIHALLDEIGEFQSNNSAQDRSFYKLGNELGGVLIGLSSCERVAIWSMTPSALDRADGVS